MELQNLSRREFINAAAAVSATVMAAGVVSKVLGADAAATMGKRIFICSVCGHAEFGAAPEFCPVCHASRDQFKQNDTVFSDAEASYKDKTDSHRPALIVKKQDSLITEQPGKSVDVRIGKVLHPMEEAHHIRFIDCYIDDKYIARQILTTNSYAAAGFHIKAPGTRVCVVELCTLHGYWQAEA
jgi:desulfoferrodoxin-like iron-binding protein